METETRRFYIVAAVDYDYRSGDRNRAVFA
jgi:hypothetical protein